MNLCLIHSPFLFLVRATVRTWETIFLSSRGLSQHRGPSVYGVVDLRRFSVMSSYCSIIPMYGINTRFTWRLECEHSSWISRHMEVYAEESFVYIWRLDALLWIVLHLLFCFFWFFVLVFIYLLNIFDLHSGSRAQVRLFRCCNVPDQTFLAAGHNRS